MAILETVEEFNLLMKFRALSENKQKLQEFKRLFGELIENLIKEENKITAIKPKENSIVATIKFTTEEIAKMDKNFQRIFKETGNVARVIKTIKNRAVTYEIRYRRNGYNISVFSPDIIEAKQKFIQETKLKNIKIGA